MLSGREADELWSRILVETARLVADTPPARAWARILHMLARRTGSAVRWVPERPAAGQAAALSLRRGGLELGVLLFDGEAPPISHDTAAPLSALLSVALPSEPLEVEAAAAQQQQVGALIGPSPQLARVREVIALVRDLPAPVLVEGESGTGKELVARALHVGQRSSHPFVAVDCASLSEQLAEAELFGRVRGAYTGADNDREGLFEAAHGGTLFLDEVTNIHPALQGKLLRVLQEREVRRVGDAVARPIDVRVVSASNRDLKEEVRSGRFRQDLYYRLNVISIYLPPLRERSEDILPLFAHFLASAFRAAGRPEPRLGDGVHRLLLAEPWQGNARELWNLACRLSALSAGPELAADELAALLASGAGRTEAAASLEAAELFRRLVSGEGEFYELVVTRYRKRQIRREEVRELVARGLEAAGGRYREVAALFGVPAHEYRRFMSFLRDNEVHLDYRPFRGRSAPD